MLRPLPEEHQGLPDPNVHLMQEEAQLLETRLRRKMVVNPKRNAPPLAVSKTKNRIPTAVRFPSPMNLIFAVLSSASFGWAVLNWRGR